ncbi:MAG TPA: TylF/MycF family methyltransferase [Acidobacteriaceae bacterium]|jgi:O-methyltransferase|nr:TylF/MycF family methyltransferase [Acidobacteriaceae bacterium]
MSYTNVSYDGAITGAGKAVQNSIYLPDFVDDRIAALRRGHAVETPAEDLYLDLLKKALTRTAFPDRLKPLMADRMRSKSIAAWAAFRAVRPLLDAMGLVLCRANYNAAWREIGADWPADAETMVGMKRLDNVEFCVKDVLANHVPGDLIETGVWRGGVCILMEAILKLYGAADRRLWLADSFEGLPKPDGRYAQDSGDTFHRFKESLGVSLEEVKANFERYGMLAENVHFLKGWFKDTLPAAPVTRIAVLRLDGDMYASTMDALNSLYGKVSVGGYTIVDDYGAVPACRHAVDDFRAEHGITEPVQAIDWAGIYWKKEAGSC